MRRLESSPIWLVVALLGTAGCERAAPPPGGGSGAGAQASPRRVSGEEVKQQTREAVEVTLEYLRQQGAELRARAERKLVEVQPQIEQWKQDGRELGAEAKAKAAVLARELEEQRRELAEELERVRRSPDQRREMVEDLKRELGSAIEKVDRQLQVLQERLGADADSSPAPSPVSTPDTGRAVEAEATPAVAR